MNMREKIKKVHELNLKIIELKKEINKIVEEPCDRCCDSCIHVWGNHCKLANKDIPENVFEQGCECWEETKDFVPF